MKRVLISGANSGIGRAAAIDLAAHGYRVFAGMRDLGKAEKLLEGAAAAGTTVEAVQLDVNSAESVSSCVEGIRESGGPIEVLVNNAGIALNGTVEDIDIDSAREVFETNYWGVLRLTQAVLPEMRTRGSGHVLNVSSVTGRIAALGQVIYASSKWAVECLSENLAQEMAPFGIRVSIIEPGITRTAILPKNAGHPTPTHYEDAYRRMLLFYAAGIEAARPASEVAEVMREAIETDTPRLRYPCTWGGTEICEGRKQMTDEDWVDLGRAETDEAYFARFKELFGLSVPHAG